MFCFNNYLGSSIFCLACACAAKSPGDRNRGGDGTVGYRNNGRRQSGSTKLGWQWRRRRGLASRAEHGEDAVPQRTAGASQIEYSLAQRLALLRARFPGNLTGEDLALARRILDENLLESYGAARLFCHRGGRPMCRRSVKLLWCSSLESK